MRAEFGDDWLPVTRFAVRQKSKLRPIDNFAENHCNQAWGQAEKLDLHALDQLVWLLALLHKVAADRGCFEVPLKNGGRLRGRVHETWTPEKLETLISTIDLQDAYKQLGIHRADRARAVAALKGSEGRQFDMYAHELLAVRGSRFCSPFSIGLAGSRGHSVW